MLPYAHKTLALADLLTHNNRSVSLALLESRGETLPDQNSLHSKPLRAQLQGDPFLGCHFPQPLNAIAIEDASLTLQPF
jgi:hypothetical protein